VPQAYVNKLAKKHGMGVSTAERRWNRAKSVAKSEGRDEDYAYITGIFKKMMNEGYNSKREHEYNMDADQREMDSRDAQGEDMSDAYVDPKTYEIKSKKKVKKPVVGEKFTFKDFLMLEQGVK
jgi:hypothetical protein